MNKRNSSKVMNITPTPQWNVRVPTKTSVPRPSQAQVTWRLVPMNPPSQQMSIGWVQIHRAQSTLFFTCKHCAIFASILLYADNAPAKESYTPLRLLLLTMDLLRMSHFNVTTTVATMNVVSQTRQQRNNDAIGRETHLMLQQL